MNLILGEDGITTINILIFLLPGFVAMGIFYSFTSHPETKAFNHVIRALIFTVTAQALIVAIKFFGKDSIPKESILYVKELEFVWPILVAIVLGLIAVWFSNKDIAHRFLRHLGITQESSYSPGWHSSFSRNRGYIVLHLEGERRLYGWPEEWPNSPDEGHFRIAKGEWLVGDTRVPLGEGSAILIPAKAVEMVEFMTVMEQSEE